jgi:hypothetical protein
VRVQAKDLHGETLDWDGSPESLERIRVLAADSFLRTHGEYLIVTTQDEVACWVRPGWFVTRWDGNDYITVSAPHSRAMIQEPERRRPERRRPERRRDEDREEPRG